MSDVRAQDDLSRFLAAARGRAFCWSRLGCAALACDWLADRTGRDPAAGLRVRIRCEISARRELAHAGGFAGLARRAGLAATDRPGRGDVGAIGTGLRAGDVLAVCLGGDAWAFQGERNPAMVTRPVVRRAWACPQH